MGIPVHVKYVYSIGEGAILDIDNPSLVKYRCENFLLAPGRVV